MADTLTAIIVDDEEKSCMVLRSLLNSFFPEINIVGEASNADDAFELINETDPQLVFLDIQMPGGDGFSLLRKWTEIPFDVIFVTSFDQYAISAIRFSALDYLQKPIEIEDLRFAVGKAMRAAKQRERMAEKVGNLLENLQVAPENKTISVHVSDKVRVLPVSEIAYIEADASYCQIYLGNGETFVIAKLMRDFEDYLSDVPSFVRIHRSFLINTGFIREYTKGETCVITMRDGKSFEVARRKKHEVLARLR